MLKKKAITAKNIAYLSDLRRFIYRVVRGEKEPEFVKKERVSIAVCFQFVDEKSLEIAIPVALVKLVTITKT